jgi:N-acyl-L-homoserine lactone synthetase
VTDDDAADILTTADGMARRALAGLAPLRLAVAQTDAEREVAFRLRYGAVVDRGWRSPEDLAGQRERDQYDEDALQLVAWDGDTAIGCARLVLPTPGLLLPTEAAFGILVEPRGEIVDAGRFVVTRGRGDGGHRILLGLISLLWLTARERGYSLVCSAFASRSAIHLYDRLGFRTEVLAPPMVVWGEERFPLLWDGAGSVSTLEATSARLDEPAP